MGRLGVIPSYVQRIFCILIGCFVWHGTDKCTDRLWKAGQANNQTKQNRNELCFVIIFCGTQCCNLKRVWRVTELLQGSHTELISKVAEKNNVK